MTIDRYQAKINTFTADLSEHLDRDKRTLVTCEVDIYEESERDNGDGTFNKVYRCKVNGTTILKQGDNKPILAKSKRSKSQKLRMAFWKIDQEDEFYEVYMDKLMFNLEDVIQFLKDK